MILKKHILTIAILILGFLIVSNSPVSAKDEWVKVTSKNFKLVGNATDKDIRKVATKLEQFREVFRSVFGGINFDSSIPTNVIVFKSNSAYKPFKPKRADGKIDDFVAGYFQPGEDVNYITLSTEGEDKGTFEVIFHEYVHFLVNTNIGKSDVPPWFNEGLAEYYETFAIEQDQTAKLGIFKQNHLDLLSQTKLMPLETLFSVSNYALHQQGNHSRSIFYAQSWALIHYLIQTGKSEGLSKFLLSSMKNTPPPQVFKDSFQMTYVQMEKELSKYVSQNSYKYQMIDFKNKLVFEKDMQSSPLSEASANAYLGDLLFHTNRADDAEPFLQKSIALEPDQSAAHTTLGMVKFRQRKYAEAKVYLEKAVAEDNKNSMAFYYYAYCLSRENQNDLGYVAKFSGETSVKMRDALKKSIALNPSFGASYDLLAFVSLVKNENLDEAALLLQKAIISQPGNQSWAMRLAEIYLRQEKYDDAKAIAEKIAKTADEPDVKSNAENMKSRIQQTQENRARYEASRKEYEEATKNRGGQSPIIRRNQPNGKTLTPEEIAKIQEEEMLISLNQAIRKVGSGEKQVIGRITKIACAGGKVVYTVKTEKETITLFSKDFENLALVSLAEESGNIQVGCNENIAAVNTVLTFKEPVKPGANGELLAIDFVPGSFKFVAVDKSKALSDVFDINNSNSKNSNLEDPTKDAMLDAIKNAMRKVQDGEKREQGFIEKIECDNKGMYMFFKTDTQIIKLSRISPTIPITAFTPDIQGIQFGCGLKQLDILVVFTYKPNADPKSKIPGDLISLEFMPKSFKLENF